jgi:hypothetical protein
MGDVTQAAPKKYDCSGCSHASKIFMLFAMGENNCARF